MSWNKMYKYCLAVVLCTLGVTIAAFAQNQTHTVRSGETLFSIARQYDITVQNLKEWNNLRSNELDPGQALIIRRTAPDESVVHTVKPQETLFSISKMYGVNISEIKTWNNLNGNTLEIGQELTIHIGKTNTPSGQTDSRESIVVENNVENNTYYTVKSGDTLYKIAREHNMTLDELKRLNDLETNTISIGQQLTVKAASAPPSVTESALASSPQGKFVSYQAEAPLELDEVLQKFEMTRAELSALNPDWSPGKLRKGQKITVLAPPTRKYKNPYQTDANLKNLGETSVSRYSSSEGGKTTTSGELYNPDELTAAHSNIAMGTVMFIQNSQNGKGVYIRINDRISGKGLKLSQAVWQALEFTSSNPSVKIFQDQ